MARCWASFCAKQAAKTKGGMSRILSTQAATRPPPLMQQSVTNITLIMLKNYIQLTLLDIIAGRVANFAAYYWLDN